MAKRRQTFERAARKRKAKQRARLVANERQAEAEATSPVAEKPRKAAKPEE